MRALTGEICAEQTSPIFLMKINRRRRKGKGR
jgi:hypothetical protein